MPVALRMASSTVGAVEAGHVWANFAGTPANLLVRLAGIEPATFGFEVRRSIRLSYRRVNHVAYTRRGSTCPETLRGDPCERPPPLLGPAGDFPDGMNSP